MSSGRSEARSSDRRLIRDGPIGCPDCRWLLMSVSTAHLLKFAEVYLRVSLAQHAEPDSGGAAGEQVRLGNPGG